MPHDAALYATGVKSKDPTLTAEDFEDTVIAARDEYQSSADASLAQFQGRVDYEEPPTITAIDPTEFEAVPEDTELSIIVTGNGFTGTTSVTLGAVAATTVTITDDLELEAVFPIPVAEALLNVVVNKGTRASNTVSLDFTIAP